MPDLPLPIEFRMEILQQVVSILRSGESCALVGVGDSGKSNVARHLTRADVRLRYFGADAAQTFVLYVNCKPFAQHAPHDLYLDMLDKLGLAADELDGAFAPLRPGIAALWHEAQANPATLARRSLDRALGQIERAGAQHIIFILDDCDDLFARCPPVLFADLRELRDNHKLRVVYLTLTRRDPSYLRENTPEYEELFELLSAGGHVIAILPYLEDDGFYMLRRLAAREDPPHTLTEAEIRVLYALAGGHGGLLRSLYFATRHNADLISPDALDRLGANPDMQSMCEKVLNSLEEEKNDLVKIALRGTPSAKGLRRLRHRGLIRPGLSGAPGIFSPVFKRYLEIHYGPLPERLQIDFPGPGWQVIINGESVNTLNWPEFEVLRCLYQKRPQPCSITELIEAVRLAERGRPAERAQGNPAQRLNQYIQQLKAKIGPAGKLIRQEGDSYRIVS